MRPDSTPVKICLPPISDEAVVEIHDFLNNFLRLFESHYGAQIHRFYETPRVRIVVALIESETRGR